MRLKTTQGLCVAGVALGLVAAATVSASADGPPTTLPPLPAGLPYTSIFPQPEDPGAAVRMEGCYVSFIGLPTTTEHARRYVPAQYTPAGGPLSQAIAQQSGDPNSTTDDAMLDVWELSCDYTTAGARAIGPMKLSLVGVRVAPRSSDVQQNPVKAGALSPPTASAYVFKVHTDNPTVFGLLHDEGLPVELTPNSNFSYVSADAGDFATITPPPSDPEPSSYAFSVDAHSDDLVSGPHDHDNQFWYVTRSGAVDLRLKLHDARDLNCSFREDYPRPCSGTVTSLSSAINGFLGGAARVSSLALRHHKVPVGDLTLEGPGARSPSAARSSTRVGLRVRRSHGRYVAAQRHAER